MVKSHTPIETHLRQLFFKEIPSELKPTTNTTNQNNNNNNNNNSIQNDYIEYNDNSIISPTTYFIPLEPFHPSNEPDLHTNYNHYFSTLLQYYYQFISFTSSKINIILSLTIFSIFIKLVIGTFGHSGYQTPPLRGDFEAQRHWLEITTNLLPHQWYVHSSNNDLNYWGLDYPPVSAFWAYICGKIGAIYYPAMTALFTSRGMEDEKTRLFMKVSVIIGDFLLFIPGVLLISTVIMEMYQVRPTITTKLTNTTSTTTNSSSTTNQNQQSSLNTTPTQHITIDQANYINYSNSILLTLSLLFQPLLLLIDHGHFQYNGMCIGLLFTSMYYTLQHDFTKVAIFFPLCCFFKQTGLYFALPLFTYIVAVLLHPITNEQKQSTSQSNQSSKSQQQQQSQQQIEYGPFRITFKSIFIFIKLALISSFIFGLCFIPFLFSAASTIPIKSSITQQQTTLYPEIVNVPIYYIQQLTTQFYTNHISPQFTLPNQQHITIYITTIQEFYSIFFYQLLPQFQSLLQPTIIPIIQRMFPFKRGLFEDKVASIWCITNVIIKWHEYFNIQTLTRFSTLLTLLLIIPSLILLFISPTKKSLLYSCVISSLSFFLCSMQIHEKTILYTLLPLCLLSLQHPLLYKIVTIIANGTCLFLLHRDGQFTPAVVIQTCFILLSPMSNYISNPSSLLLSSSTSSSSLVSSSTSSQQNIYNYILLSLSISMIIFLVYAKWFIFIQRLPHLWELAMATYGCGTFLFTWLFLLIQQYKLLSQ